ncbi:MAG: putative mannose-6-phosphate isomerase GmuF [Planctomycetota bacterium]
MSSCYPLRFAPLFRRYLWGGRRLESHLGKAIGEGDDYAESWEIVDRRSDQSTVQFGPLAGQTLHELAARDPESFYGSSSPPPRSFPLLFKFLDAHQTLSVQVHPTDLEAAKLNPPDLGKTEAWVILHAEPGSKIYAGLKSGVDSEMLRTAVKQGMVADCLHQFEPVAGDCVFIPAGTVHALGAGLIVAEIQQASDTTYRLFDWNRVGADGKPRPLHIEESIKAIHFELGAVDPQAPRPTGNRCIERLVECDKFVLDRCRTSAAIHIGGDNRFHLLVNLGDAILIEGDPAGRPLHRGEVALLPAALGATAVTPERDAEFLDIYLPSTVAIGTAFQHRQG